MEYKNIGISLSLPEVEQEDLSAYVDYDDFLRRYGNPVIVKSKGHGDLVCMAREYYERLVLDLEYFRGQDQADYWIYEFSATSKRKLEFEKAAAQAGMTSDEYLADIMKKALEQACFDPERPQQESVRKAEKDTGIRLVRYYPVYKGETEEQAYLRQLEQEAAELKSQNKGGERHEHTGSIYFEEERRGERDLDQS